MSKKTPTAAIIISIIVVLLLCIAVLCVGMIWAGVGVFNMISTVDIAPFNPPATSTPVPQGGAMSPTPTPLSPIVMDAPELADLKAAQESLDTLNDTVVPINDPIDLASRLGGKLGVPDTLIDVDAPHEVGASKKFWVTNTDNNKNFQVDATLRYRGENVYFWIEDGVSYRDTDLRRLGDTFDEEIIPTNREFFGSEWNPGVDGDPRIYVLYAGGLGYSIAGYYSSADELHPDAHPYSNAHEMFLMNSDTVGLGEEYIYGTMAHEFQHMIHWYQDKNEETWVNEGFSMLAEHVNGLDAGGFDYEYMLNPDMQLTDWGTEPGSNGPHYGASYLFMVYFLDRFGEEATKTFVSHDENGLASLAAVMEDVAGINPDTDQPYTGNEFFADWAVANLLQNSGIENGRYDYQSYNPYSLDVTETAAACPLSINRDVHQYGVDYIEVECLGAYTIGVSGSDQVRLLPFDRPTSGEYYFWSNMGDESNPTLTQEFDLSAITGEVSLQFRTWFDIETDYDYVYLSATIDGLHWEILDSLTCTTDNPSGNSYGCGWNGHSDGWMTERVDLSAYAGEKVTLRFDYVTDAAVNGKGMALDDFRIDAIGYQSDLEADDGGWFADGFVRLQNYLPQTYNLSLVSIGDTVTVNHFTLAGTATLEIPVEIGGTVDRIVLVISGTTPVTREKAEYSLSIR